ncbi:uncharacterized protein L201_003977 [Kwoniella dendrophila CBS 6074]|uniref:Uncharacterized protein n=1 Tax=Kwoniella dendrophila CBS 6074 TaxID=1295534 RepID=A0AAX4JVX7_9TREE
MSEYFDLQQEGISKKDDQTCISSGTWNVLIKSVLVLTVIELIIFIIFFVLRSKRHSIDRQQGIVHVQKSKLLWRIKRKSNGIRKGGRKRWTKGKQKLKK